MSSGPKIFLVDDEPHLLEMLCDEFRLHGLTCETFARAEEFVMRAPWTEIGCLITDLAMPGMGGRQLINLCKEHSPLFSVVVYSATADIVTAVDAMRSGVFYVFEKERPLAELIPIVLDGVAQSRNLAAARQAQDATRDSLERLTTREREVLMKIASGHPNKVIAAELGISINTVEVHRGRVMRKMGAESVAELARALAAIGL